MGNRAVITTQFEDKNELKNQLGIYLHWNGGKDSVDAFLTYCKLRGFRSLDTSYVFARLTQIIANFFGGGTSIGIGTTDNLDCDNYDNGVYFIKDWLVVGREYYEGKEQNEYKLLEMLTAIDNAQPETERLGTEIINQKLIEYGYTV